MLPRRLAPAEIDVLRPVFGGSLRYRLVRLTLDGPLAAGSTKVVGNTIHFLSRQMVPAILVHEAVHVWQWQLTGWYYAWQSLRDQFAAWRRCGSRGGAYDWTAPARAGRPWGGLRSEPQAQLIEDAWRAGLVHDRRARLIADGRDFTDYARAALAELAAGGGAPRGA